MLRAILSYAVVLLGLIPSGIFLCIHRPLRKFRRDALNASGWVLILFFLYVRSLILLVLRGTRVGVVHVNTLDDSVRYLMGFAIAALLWYRLYTYLKYASAYRRAMQEDASKGGE
jgi:hypothetical protein